MKCIEFRSAMENAIEQKTTLVSDALEHLDECFECRNIWEIQNRVDEALAVWKTFQPPDPPIHAVLAALQRSRVSGETNSSNLIRKGVINSNRRPANQVASTTTRINSRHFRNTGFLLVTVSVACVVLVFLMVVMDQSFVPSQQVDLFVNTSSDDPTEVRIAESKPDAAGEISELVADRRNQVDWNTIESTPAQTSPVIGHESIATLIPSVPKDSQDHAISTETELRGNPVVDRFKRGFGFLFQTF